MSVPAELPLATPPRRWEWWGLGLILLVAVALRVHKLDATSLWLDEIFTIMLAAGHGVGFKEIPVGTVLERGPDLTGFGDVPAYAIPFKLRQDVHPPLVYLLLHAWIGAGGKGDFWVRLFPAVFSVGSAVTLFFAARRTVGGMLALGVVAVAAVSAIEIYYAQEVRSYTLLQLLMVGAILAALRVVERASAGRLALWAGLMLGLCLTHYFAVGAAAGLGAWLLFAVTGRDKMRVMVAGAAAAGAFGVLWGPFLLQQGRGGLGGDHMAAKEAVTAIDVLARAATFPARAILPPLPQTGGAVVLVGAALLLAVVAMAVFASRRAGDEVAQADAGGRWWRSLVLAWWACLVGSLLMQVALDLAKGTITIRFPRYSFHVVPAVYVCAAWLLVPVVRHRVARAVPVALLACAAAYGTAKYGYQQKAIWRDLAVWVGGQATAADAIVFLSERPNDWRPGANYMCLSHYSAITRRVPVLLLDGSHPATAEALATLARRQRVFVISSMPRGSAVSLPGFEAVNVAELRQTTGDAPRSAWVFSPAKAQGPAMPPSP